MYKQTEFDKGFDKLSLTSNFDLKNQLFQTISILNINFININIDYLWNY